MLGWNRPGSWYGPELENGFGFDVHHHHFDSCRSLVNAPTPNHDSSGLSAYLDELRAIRESSVSVPVSRATRPSDYDTFDVLRIIPPPRNLELFPSFELVSGSKPTIAGDC